MPLPLGHAAVGLAVYSVSTNVGFGVWKDSWLSILIFVSVLANLPDMDFLFGLLYKGDASLMHRGPTHTIYFALLFGFLSFWFVKHLNWIPNISFTTCFLVILSHPVLDICVDIFYKKSLFWKGFSSLFYSSFVRVGNNVSFTDILSRILKSSLADFKIIILSFVVILFVIFVKKII